MKKFILTAILLLVPFSSLAMVSPASLHLEALRVKAEAEPSRSNELAYLASFPQSYRAFHHAFYGSSLDELYPKYEEHLRLLNSLAHKYPEVVLSIQLNISASGHWDADAVGMLQEQLISVAATSTARFASALTKRSAAQQISIITFLADAEDHAAYPEYRDAIRALRSLGYVSLAHAFEVARDKRERANDH